MIALLIAGCIGGGIYYFLSQKDSRSLNDDEEDTEMVDEEEDMDDEEDMDKEDDTYIVEEADEEEEEAVEEEKAEPAQPTTRRMNLSGDADGYPLALSLEIGPDNRVTGTFNDESTGNTTQVSGTMTNGSIRLTGRGCTFRIAPEGHIYTGTLTKGNGKSQELHLVSR